MPVHEVEETSTVKLTIEKPQDTLPKDVVFLRDGEELKSSDHVKITSTSPTTTEIQIVKVTPEDEGDYTVEVKGVEQPLVRLKVHPKPVVQQELQLPKATFNEKETLTIVCQFDARPEEAFIFLHNDQPIVPNDRVTTTVEDNKYTIVVKDLRPEEDEGVYTLKSDHLILNTPAITIVAEEKKPQTETTTTVEEEVVTVVPQKKQPQTETTTVEEEVVTVVPQKEQPQTETTTTVKEVVTVVPQKEQPQTGTTTTVEEEVVTVAPQKEQPQTETTTVEEEVVTVVPQKEQPQAETTTIEEEAVTVAPQKEQPQTETTTVEEEVVTVVPRQKEQPQTIVQEVEEVTQIIEEKKVCFFVFIT